VSRLWWIPEKIWREILVSSFCEESDSDSPVFQPYRFFSRLSLFSCSRKLNLCFWLGGEMNTFEYGTTPCFLVSRNWFQHVEEKNFKICFILGSSASFISWHILRPYRWKRHVHPKRRLNFNGLHGVISQKIGIFRRYLAQCGTMFLWSMSAMYPLHPSASRSAKERVKPYRFVKCGKFRVPST
jgi:hypothetical protein